MAFRSRKVLLYHIFPFLYPLSFILTLIYGIWDLTPAENKERITKYNRHKSDVLI